MREEHFTINDEYVSYEMLSIQKLFLHILIRALRDLEEDPDKRRSATKWFSKWKNTMPYSVSFRDVCETLGLTASAIERIKRGSLVGYPMRGRKKSVL